MKAWEAAGSIIEVACHSAIGNVTSCASDASELIAVLYHEIPLTVSAESAQRQHSMALEQPIVGAPFSIFVPMLPSVRSAIDRASGAPQRVSCGCAS